MVQCPGVARAGGGKGHQETRTVARSARGRSYFQRRLRPVDTWKNYLSTHAMGHLDTMDCRKIVKGLVRKLSAVLEDAIVVFFTCTVQS